MGFKRTRVQIPPVRWVPTLVVERCAPSRPTNFWTIQRSSLQYCGGCAIAVPSAPMLSAGIVGLPNVGKSTLFNAVTRTHKAPAENYPFCTIDPNVGVVTVPDRRLEKIAEISHSKKITPTAIEFVDIAGLVKGPSAGEGLGNQLLHHIRQLDGVVQVVR